MVKVQEQWTKGPYLDNINNQQALKEMKSRTTFYMALGRLLNLDFSDDDDTFDKFIRPTSNYS